MAHPIYFDYNATTPLAPEVREAMDPWLDSIPTNPGAVHSFGRAARAAVEQAREQVADLCGGGDVIFTSGGTEADNLALSCRLGWPPRGHVVVSDIEHPAVLAACASLAALGVEISTLSPCDQGRVCAEDLESAIREDTRIVSVQAANNETGTVQPVAELAAVAERHGVPLHTDAVQAASWFNLPELLGGASMISLAGHKIAGPTGVGALVLRTPMEVQPTLHGGGQQRARRPGTEPTALLVGFGAACERASRERVEQAERVGVLARELVGMLKTRIPEVRITVTEADRMPNTVHVAFPDCPADLLVARADLDGLAISAGSACASGLSHGSHVLAALGVPARYRDGAVRISLGYGSTREEVEGAALILAASVDAVRYATPDVAPA